VNVLPPLVLRQSPWSLHHEEDLVVRGVHHDVADDVQPWKVASPMDVPGGSAVGGSSTVALAAEVTTVFCTV
jgi:galactokinase/mevalonate kinase-like predicted kinase